MGIAYLGGMAERLLENHSVTTLAGTYSRKDTELQRRTSHKDPYMLYFRAYHEA
jgi:hypothetical protein